MKYFRKSLPYLKPHWRLAVWAVLLTFALGGLNTLGPWPISFIIDGPLGKGTIPHWVNQLTHRDIRTTNDRYFYIYLAVIAFMAYNLVSGVLSVVTDYILTLLQQRMTLDFRSKLFEHSLELSIAYHDQRRSGMMIYIINGMGNAPVSLLMKIPYLIQNVTQLVWMFWILFSLDRTLAYASMAVVPFLYYSVGYYATHIQHRLRTVKGMEGESLAIIHEALSMIRVIFAFNRQDYEYQRFRLQGEDAVDARVKVTNRQNIFTMVVSLITAIGTACVLWIGARHVLSGWLTVGQLWVLLAYIAAIYKPLEAISYAIGDLQDQFMNLQIAFALVDTRPQIEDSPQAVPLSKVAGRVRFENVAFHYEDREQTLKNISFTANAGDVVAIVGPTGAGKSSLVSLIPRFYDLTGGAIYIDDVDIRNASVQSLRDQIAIVVQEPLLFSGSIKENIRYGRLEATDDEVVEAAKIANAHDFITALPEGYNTLLGERGAQISGGERQRLAAARAMVKNAPILILDEPTSAIDSQTEAVILQALDRVMAGRTTFMIAHRLSTVRRANLILVIDKGEIVERGTHDELVALGGLYARLHELQSGITPPESIADLPAAAEIPTITDSNPLENPPIESEEKPSEASQAPAIITSNKVVVLGMMSRWPVGGVAWVTVQYLEGLRRLGYDVYYVEAHGCTQTKFMRRDTDDGAALAAAYIEKILRRFGFADRWAYHDVHQGNRCFGMSLLQLNELYQNAGLIINLHAGTEPLPEHAATNRLLYLETDPVEVQIGLYNGSAATEEFLKAHCAYYTWGLNYGNPDCRLPLFDRFPYKTTCPLVVADFWQNDQLPPVKLDDRKSFTTIGNWKQGYKEVIYNDELFHWSKHLEFEKFLHLPGLTGQSMQLALASASIDPDDLHTLAEHGWNVVDGDKISDDLDLYRDYIRQSKAEFTVAKDQNVRLRSGWFSERSAQYMAAGRPVIMQETAFSNVLPTGEGLFSFLTIDEAAAAVDEVASECDQQSAAAADIAREYFNYDRVLPPIMSDMGM